MATGTTSTESGKKNAWDVTALKMKKLLSLTTAAEFRTRLKDPAAHMALRYFTNNFMLATQLKNLNLNEGDVGKCQIPIYFCPELSSRSLEVVLAYCYSAFCTRYDQSTVFSIYYTLIVNLSGELCKNDINDLMKDKFCVANLKSFPDAESMLAAMNDDEFVSGISVMVNRQNAVLKSRYENQLCMVAYLFIVALKDNKLRMQNVLKTIAEAVNVTVSFESLEIRTVDDQRDVYRTFEETFDFRKNIFKHLVSLATRDDQLGIVLRLVVQMLQFTKMEKWFYIRTYFTPYCPSILNLHEMKSPRVRSALSIMEDALTKFDECEVPYIWFLDECFDDINSPLLDLVVGIALAIKKFKQPEFQPPPPPNPWTSTWFSSTMDRSYNLRKEDVFEYLRRFESVAKTVQIMKSDRI